MDDLCVYQMGLEALRRSVADLENAAVARTPTP